MPNFCALCRSENLETLVQIDFWSAKRATHYSLTRNQMQNDFRHSSFNLKQKPYFIRLFLYRYKIVTFSPLHASRDGILKEAHSKQCHFYASRVTNFRQPNKKSKKKFNIRKTKQKSIIKQVKHIHTHSRIIITQENERFAFVRSFLKNANKQQV